MVDITSLRSQRPAVNAQRLAKCQLVTLLQALGSRGKQSLLNRVGLKTAVPQNVIAVVRAQTQTGIIRRALGLSILEKSP